MMVILVIAITLSLHFYYHGTAKGPKLTQAEKKRRQQQQEKRREKNKVYDSQASQRFGD